MHKRFILILFLNIIFSVDGKNHLTPTQNNQSDIIDLGLALGDARMIHSLKVQLSDYGLLESSPNDVEKRTSANDGSGDDKGGNDGNGTALNMTENGLSEEVETNEELVYKDFEKMQGNLNKLWEPSVRMTQYVPSKEVEAWWRLFAETLPPNSFSGSAGFGSPCIFAKYTDVCPTKRLEEMDAFKDFKEMMEERKWGELRDANDRPNEFIGFDRLKVELIRRYGGEEWKKEEFEKEVHKRMRIELQKQIDAKEGFQIDPC